MQEIYYSYFKRPIFRKKKSQCHHFTGFSFVHTCLVIFSQGHWRLLSISQELRGGRSHQIPVSLVNAQQFNG